MTVAICAEELRSVIRAEHDNLAARSRSRGNGDGRLEPRQTTGRPLVDRSTLSLAREGRTYKLGYTPAAQRESRARKREPWSKNGQRKSDLLKKLAEAEQKHDFYSRLYKQYTVDLLRLAVYARSLIN